MLLLRILLLALVVVCLGGCGVFRRGASAKAPAPPPPRPAQTAARVDVPLSIPQTRVELPPPQPLDPEALQEGPPPVPEPVEVPPPAKPPRRAPAGPPPQPPPEPPGPQPQAPAAEERPRLQEIISAEERKRLLDDIGNRKREIAAVIAEASRRSASAQDRDAMERIRSFVQQCDQAAERGDIRQADALCGRALVLARGLRRGR